MWLYKDSVINNISKFPEDAFGFIYRVVNIDTGRFYIGKKQLWSVRNVKLGKKELEEIAEQKRPGKKPTKKKIIKESDWLLYHGSEPEIKKDVKELGLAAFKREILHIAMNKKELTYMEIKYQMIYEVLERDDSYNSNIEGRYFKKDFVK